MQCIRSRTWKSEYSFSIYPKTRNETFISSLHYCRIDYKTVSVEERSVWRPVSLLAMLQLCRVGSSLCPGLLQLWSQAFMFNCTRLLLPDTTGKTQEMCYCLQLLRIPYMNFVIQTHMKIYTCIQYCRCYFESCFKIK